jgi:hypothetical protein
MRQLIAGGAVTTKACHPMFTTRLPRYCVRLWQMVHCHARGGHIALNDFVAVIRPGPSRESHSSFVYGIDPGE